MDPIKPTGSFLVEKNVLINVHSPKIHNISKTKIDTGVFVMYFIIF